MKTFPLRTRGILAAILAVLLVTTGGCSLLGRALEHGQQLLETRQERQQSGWSFDGWFTCEETSHLEIDGSGDRWCSRRLAPTYADCMSGGGLTFWYGDSLSGISRQVLYTLCTDSKIGEHWKHLDGVFEGSRLVVRDANQGSKPL